MMTPGEPASLRRIPAGVWVLGFVSLLMDISSEMIHSLLPLFMVGALGASAFAVGLIERLAEATALMVEVFSGALLAWDRFGASFTFYGGAGFCLLTLLLLGWRTAPRIH